MTKKIISLILVMLLVLGTANTIAFADEKLLYNQNGVIVRYERSGEMDPNKDKARPVRSGGEDGKAHLDSLRIFDQSTYADKLPNHFYYRTVGFQMALLDENMLPNETDTFGASIKNSSDKPITTDVVWRVAGRQIRKVTVTIPAKGSITDRAKITMPNTEGSVTVEVEVNPSRNKPANEVTWSNNISRETIISLGSDKIPGTSESEPYLVD